MEDQHQDKGSASESIISPDSANSASANVMPIWHSRSPSYVRWILSKIFQMIVSIRQKIYQKFPSLRSRSKVPVIIIGNITVGGSGKTPLVIFLAQRLRQLDFQPAIISRGYKSSLRRASLVTDSLDAARLYGDEAAMMKRKTGLPIAIAARRNQAIQLIMEHHPDVNVILSDDGLQHYSLSGAIRICVIDPRGVGNGHFLPAGPLRESLDVLSTMDGLVNRSEKEFIVNCPIFSMTTRFGLPVKASGDVIPSISWQHLPRRVHAVSGIGDPDRFFSMLRSVGRDPIQHIFPDHHCFSPSDFDVFDDGIAPVLMTEKDAIKCMKFARPHWFSVPISVEMDSTFVDFIRKKIDEY